MSHQAGQSPASFYSSPQEALQAPPEELVYVACLHVGTGVGKPDFLAVVDVNPDSDEYGRIVHPDLYGALSGDPPDQVITL